MRNHTLLNHKRAIHSNVVLALFSADANCNSCHYLEFKFLL